MIKAINDNILVKKFIDESKKEETEIEVPKDTNPICEVLVVDSSNDIVVKGAEALIHSDLLTDRYKIIIKDVPHYFIRVEDVLGLRRLKQ